MARTWGTTALTLWRLAWPIAATSQLVFFVEAAMIFWLSRMVGPEGLAAEATLRPIVATIGYVLLAAAGGVSVLVAQSVGAKSGEGQRWIASGMTLVAVAGLVMAAVVLPLSRTLAEVLAPTGVSAATLQGYGLPAVLLLAPTLAALQVLLHAAAGAGWTRLSLMRMVADLALTVAVVPIGIQLLGLPGAPLAQAVSQAVMIVLVWRTLALRAQTYHLGAPVPLARAMDRASWAQILDVGLPPQIARIAMYVTLSYLVQRVALDGRAAVVGYGIGLTLMGWGINIGVAVSRATGIEIGQGVGAKDVARARRGLRTGIGLAVIASTLVVVLLEVAAVPLVQLFISDPVAVERGVVALRILALSLPLLAIAQVMLLALTAIKSAKRAGLLGIVADVASIAFAMSWTGESQLEVVAWTILVGHLVRVVAFALLARVLIRRAFARVAAATLTTGKSA